MIKKVDIMKDMDALTDTYCMECFVIRDLRKTRGKQGAHRFCIESCTVGEQLQFLGNEMMKVYEKK